MLDTASTIKVLSEAVAALSIVTNSDAATKKLLKKIEELTDRVTS